jgi:hypothetical protein
MLEPRQHCECCNKDLPPDADDAMICSFECTLCRDCVRAMLEGRGASSNPFAGRISNVAFKCASSSATLRLTLASGSRRLRLALHRLPLSTAARKTAIASRPSKVALVKREVSFRT